MEDASPFSLLDDAFELDALFAASPTSVASARDEQTSSWRERRRTSERKSRQKRKTNLDLMREQVKVLEFAAANVSFALGETSEPPPQVEGHEDDEVTSAGDRVKVSSEKMQDFLRRANALVKEASQLRAENSELSTMVKRRETVVAALRKLTRGMEVDQWANDVERWDEITTSTFTEWSLEACWEIVQDSMKTISKYSFDDNTTQSTGLSFMGWRDRRRLDLNTGAIHFSFTKKYRGVEAETLSTAYWEMHLDSARYIDCMTAPNVKCFYKIVQRVSPDICIVRCVEQYPTVPFKIHMLFMIFRVRTSTGFVQALRSIPCPELQQATTDDDAYWTTNFHWTRHDILSRNEKGECLEVQSSINGSVASSHVDYANRWMGEAILTVVRAESKLHGFKLIAH